MAEEKDIERLSNSDKTRTNVGGVNYSLARREDEKPEEHEVRVDIDKMKSIKPARIRKERTSSKILKAFFGEDVTNWTEAKDHIIYRLAIPALKETAWTMLGNGLNITGNKKRKKRRDYADMYEDDDFDLDDRRRERRGSLTSVATRDYSEILFDSEEQARTAVSIMNDILREYPYARVSDLYDLAQISCGTAEDKWGWYPGDFSRVGFSSCREYDEDEGKYVKKWYIRGIPEPVRLRRE